jgi:TRIAD3 protein (E3 ubiquitin-protein ligase RNF216)
MEFKLIRDKLCNDFPSIYIKEIDNALKIQNNSYTATYYYLETKLKENTLKIKKVPSKQRKLESVPELDNIFKSVKQTIDCSCCCDDKMIEDFGQCTDGHLICKVCIKKHAENTIYQQLSCKVKCIDCNEKCFGEFSEDTLKEILNERVFAEYKNLKKLEEINQLCVDDINIKLCQHCGAGTDIGENSEQYLLVCMECFKDTCLKCNQVDHPGKPCYSLGNISQGKRQEIEDKMSEALIVKCNQCNKSIFKNEGCNKVTCVCGTHNCYVCKQIIPKSVGYSHFCRTHNCDCNKCHLWEQNTKKRILAAVKEDYDEETEKLIKGLL